MCDEEKIKIEGKIMSGKNIQKMIELLEDSAKLFDGTIATKVSASRVIVNSGSKTVFITTNRHVLNSLDNEQNVKGVLYGYQNNSAHFAVMETLQYLFKEPTTIIRQNNIDEKFYLEAIRQNLTTDNKRILCGYNSSRGYNRIYGTISKDILASTNTLQGGSYTELICRGLKPLFTGGVMSMSIKDDMVFVVETHEINLRNDYLMSKFDGDEDEISRYVSDVERLLSLNGFIERMDSNEGMYFWDKSVPMIEYVFSRDFVIPLQSDKKTSIVSINDTNHILYTDGEFHVFKSCKFNIAYKDATWTPVVVFIDSTWTPGDVKRLDGGHPSKEDVKRVWETIADELGFPEVLDQIEHFNKFEDARLELLSEIDILKNKNPNYNDKDVIARHEYLVLVNDGYVYSDTLTERFGEGFYVSKDAIGFTVCEDDLNVDGTDGAIIDWSRHEYTNEEK